MRAALGGGRHAAAARAQRARVRASDGPATNPRAPLQVARACGPRTPPAPPGVRAPLRRRARAWLGALEWRALTLDCVCIVCA